MSLLILLYMYMYEYEQSLIDDFNYSLLGVNAIYVLYQVLMNNPSVAAYTQTLGVKWALNGVDIYIETQCFHVQCHAVSTPNVT